MKEFDNLNNKYLDKLKEDGVLILPNFISLETIEIIKKDALNWQKNINFNNRLSSFILGNNQWIEHVGLCSLTALKLSMNSSFIKFLDSYFECLPIIGSISIQKKVFAEKELPLHSDMGNGLAVFIYLTDAAEKSGATEFVRKSHNSEIPQESRIVRKNNDAVYIDIDKTSFSSSDIIKTSGGPGTVAIFHRAIWHKVPKFSIPGREVLIIQYFRSQSQSKDHLIKKSFLNALSEEEIRILFKHSSCNSSPSLLELGNDPNALGVYTIPQWKMIAYYVRYKLFSKVKPKSLFND